MVREARSRRRLSLCGFLKTSDAIHHTSSEVLGEGMDERLIDASRLVCRHRIQLDLDLHSTCASSQAAGAYPISPLLTS
jgi:hypothetical protein